MSPPRSQAMWPWLRVPVGPWTNETQPSLQKCPLTSHDHLAGLNLLPLPDAPFTRLHWVPGNVPLEPERRPGDPPWGSVDFTS